VATIAHQQIQLGEVELHVAECGEGEPVLLLHGFPELWYSWRHQMQAIAASGRRAIAPDLRGFGGSSAPAAIEAYDIEQLTGDLVGLLDALEVDAATVVGHDWGSDLAWKFALTKPQRVSAVVGISVPYVPRAPAAPTTLMREHIGEDFYIVWIQQPGVADAALEADVRRTLATREVWNAEWAARHDEPPTPPWMSDDDLQLYVDEFTRTGFAGGLNWYRNLDRNWEQLATYDGRTIDQPALFITGSRDPVRAFMPHEVMTGSVTDLRDVVIIDGAGHWVQQECPKEVDEALIGFLDQLAAEAS